jgi:two-component system LytT family response regulator
VRVLIVDDEHLARAVLREHLGAHADIEVVGECANGFEAVKAIAELRPELVFLDIQMPRLDGFEVVELAGAGTHYVFVTAYDQFALRAFEVHAIDYLLKPFGRERLAQALAHARERLRAPQAVAALVSAVQARHQPLERILIRDGARVQVVPVAQVDYIEAEDDYVAIVAAGRRWLKSQRLAELEDPARPGRLPARAPFLHRQAGRGRAHRAERQGRALRPAEGWRADSDQPQRLPEGQGLAALTLHQAGSSSRTSGRAKRSSISQTVPRSCSVRITRPAACTTFCMPGYR